MVRGKVHGAHSSDAVRRPPLQQLRGQRPALVRQHEQQPRHPRAGALAAPGRQLAERRSPDAPRPPQHRRRGAHQTAAAARRDDRPAAPPAFSADSFAAGCEGGEVRAPDAKDEGHVVEVRPPLEGRARRPHAAVAAAQTAAVPRQQGPRGRAPLAAAEQRQAALKEPAAPPAAVAAGLAGVRLYMHRGAHCDTCPAASLAPAVASEVRDTQRRRVARPCARRQRAEDGKGREERQGRPHRGREEGRAAARGGAAAAGRPVVLLAHGKGRPEAVVPRGAKVRRGPEANEELGP